MTCIPLIHILPLSTSVAAFQCVRTVKTSTWWDEHLTEDNAKFMKRDVAEEISQLTVDRINPLKDEPWPRHEWEESESTPSSFQS